MIAASAKALHNRGIPYCLFNSMSSTLVLQTLQVHADTQVSEEPIKEMLPFTDALPLSALYKALFLQIHEATLLTAGIIINTAYELERGIIDAIRSHPDMKGVPVYCIGPLMPVSKAETGHESIVKWLDGKKDKSVIYVAFGSIATPKPEDIRELWKALVKTEQPFLWALAKKEQHHLSEEILQKMSRQFEDDENSRCLILDWSPQKLILQHPATAVFISHCGWNSAIEGLATGVPVVAWPMSADQRPNAIELVRSGLGVLLEDTGYFSEKTVDAQDIYTALNEVADFARRGVLTKYQLAGLVWRNRLDDITSANGSAEKDFQHLVTG
ncbi:putative UDP-glycosyltransferase 73C1 [Hypsibius exemplaris]|nr:putative UDP-glycosyltransferase 73C1 [Hypsibius exemplaris]